MEQGRKTQDFKDFAGLYLLEDPIDLPPGAAQDQLNAKSDQQGQLTVRSGYLKVLFDFEG